MAPKRSPCNDRDVHRQLAQCGPHSSLVQVLQRLDTAGWLCRSKSAAATTNVKRKLGRAMAQHCDAITPYGPVSQTIDLGLDGLRLWKYMHPMALLFYLSSICTQFGDMLAASCVPGRPMRIIIYIDEICPGNPLRPEKSRTLQALYWACADWPQHILQRTAMWPTFGTIRSTMVKKLGGVSRLMAIALKIFFPEDGHNSFANGVTIVRANGDRLVFSAVFSGFLADEKAHNEISGTKGASGSKCCVSCKNVFNRVRDDQLAAHCVSIRCADSTLFERHTNQSVFDAYDYVAASSPADRPEVSQMLGTKYMPGGIMSDAHLRTIYKPVDHTIRDWQHTLVSGGVGNVLVARVMRVLISNGITIQFVSSFFMKFTLPRKHGAVQDTWITKNRLGKKMAALSSFSGTMLTIIPLMSHLVRELFMPGYPLREHADCFWKSHLIVGICSFGATDAVAFVDVLRSLINEHAVLFSKLYPYAQRPKFHHLFHIPYNIVFLQKLLSCFVTERKHRVTKRCALHTFRGIDNSATKSMLNVHCQTFVDHPEMFSPQYLVKPLRLNCEGVTLQRSTNAVLHCGGVRSNDLVWMQDRTVGQVRWFWASASGDDIAIEVLQHQRCGASDALWCTSAPTIVMVCAAHVVDAIIWLRYELDVVLVLRPVRALL